MFLFVILLIPPIALVIWYVNGRTSNTSVTRKLEQEARQRGEPLTLAELQAKHPPIPDGENAAVKLMALWETEDPLFWKAFIHGERSLPERAAEKYDPALPSLGSEARGFRGSARWIPTCLPRLALWKHGTDYEPRATVPPEIVVTTA